MLLLREIKVLRRLSQQDFSGGELAKQLKHLVEPLSVILPQLILSCSLQALG